MEEEDLQPYVGNATVELTVQYSNSILNGALFVFFSYGTIQFKLTSTVGLLLAYEYFSFIPVQVVDYLMGVIWICISLYHTVLLFIEVVIVRAYLHK